MAEKINTIDVNLARNTEVKFIGDNHIAIVKNRKSRIIMKDGEKILSDAVKIRKSNPKIKVSFMTNAPLCSKTRAFLEENGIAVIPFRE